MPDVPLTFVHLSDIHFGQESGGQLIIHDDVRDRVIDDVRTFFAARRHGGGAAAKGILVTGDVAYSGKKDEYKVAGQFLDKVAEAAGCETTAVLVAPGNHDVDLDAITNGTLRILKGIRDGGETELERQLEDEGDRERLYARLKEYAAFADGYGCPLDNDGGRAGARDFALAPGRMIRMIAWNSALICMGEDHQGKLLLGARQRKLELENGIEHVVLTHHPLHWFADQPDAWRFLKNRARMLLSGHEHLPDIRVEDIAPNGHFLHLRAGATTPPGGYDYTFNIIDFEWASDRDGLDVTVHPRVWVDDRKLFDADYNRLAGSASKRCELACPRFGAAPRPTPAVPGSAPIVNFAAEAASAPAAPASDASGTDVPSDVMEVALADEAQFARVRLRFFRDLSRVQRLTVLVEVRALPRNLDGYPTMGVERQALEKVRASGKLEEFEAAIQREIARTPEGACAALPPAGVPKA